MPWLPSSVKTPKLRMVHRNKSFKLRIQNNNNNNNNNNNDNDVYDDNNNNNNNNKQNDGDEIDELFTDGLFIVLAIKWKKRKQISTNKK